MKLKKTYINPVPWKPLSS